MVGFPKVIKTKADLVNTYKLVKKGRLKKEDWLAAVEKLENQNFIFCPILEKTEDRKGVTLMFVNEVTEGDKVKAGNVTATVKTVEHIEVEKAAEADQEAAATEGTATAPMSSAARLCPWTQAHNFNTFKGYCGGCGYNRYSGRGYIL